ncbi:hypothetical protein [Belnapia sp. F-4-1]|uniref:hypothetical protein n=1 Tax=Belnapia sp. F-4-1 TaxID=1545443 RepID=UPI0005B7C8A2|nr:hypothetical protein [Belnapia sp. F-4-1]
MRRAASPLVITCFTALFPAQAQDRGAAAGARNVAPRDGVWLSAGLRTLLGAAPGARGDATLYVSRFGGLGQRAALLELRLLPPTSGGVGLTGAYAASLLERRDGKENRAQLFRIGSIAEGQVGPMSLDGRLVAELVMPEGDRGVPRARLRARATFPAPAEGWPRPFVAEELFWEESRGFASRHRLSAGIRAIGALGGALDLDAYYQREERRGTAGFHAFVLQAIWVIGR